MLSNILLIVATLLWGVWGFAEKQALRSAHPLTVQWMYMLPYIVFIPISYWLGSRIAPETNTNGDALKWAVVAGLAGIFAVLFFLFGLQNRAATVAVAITAGYPIVTMLLSIAAGTESFSPIKLVGVLLVIAGIVVLTFAEA
jgi:bacterial/archaeal transporter family protein